MEIYAVLPLLVKMEQRAHTLVLIHISALVWLDIQEKNAKEVLMT